MNPVSGGCQVFEVRVVSELLCVTGWCQPIGGDHLVKFDF